MHFKPEYFSDQDKMFIDKHNQNINKTNANNFKQEKCNWTNDNVSIGSSYQTMTVSYSNDNSSRFIR